MINHERLIKNFLEITAIEGVSRNEAGVMNEIQKRLDELGIGYVQDKAGEKFDGNCGNLIARIPGTIPGEAFCFSAHVDTIQSSCGTPYIKDGVIYSDGKTVLGADDRAGAAIMLEAVESAFEQKIDFPDIELLFLVGEEIGLFGSRFLDYSLVKSKYGFVIDSSADLGKIVSHAPDHSSCKIEVFGKASHAAIAPEQGIHAIKIAADGIHNTELGRVSENSTVSIGVINGGTKTNITPEHVEVQGEIRSLDKSETPVYKEKLEANFKNAAEQYGGSVKFEWQEEYSGFKLEDNSRIIEWISSALTNAGIDPEPIKFVGGSDANNFNQNGIQTVNLGLGYKKNHSNEEYIKVDDLVGMGNTVLEIIKLSGQ